MEEQKTKLFRTYKWYKPLSTMLENGKQVELYNIKIYDKKGIIFETGGGFFDNDVEIEIKNNIILKRKADFTKKTNFVVSARSWSNEPNYTLFIHKNNVNIKFIGFRKDCDVIMKDFEINGGKLSTVYKHLDNQYYIEFKKKLNNIYNKMSEFPFDIQETKTIFNNLMKINELATKEEQKMKYFYSTLFKEEERKINKMLNEEV